MISELVGEAFVAGALVFPSLPEDHSPPIRTPNCGTN